MGRRILVVDDDVAVRLLFREALEREGYEVSEAANGREGLAALEEGRPDVVVLDLLMPVMDGWQMRAAQRERPGVRDVPVILVSGSPPRILPIEAKALQVAGCLSKPVRPSALLEAVDQVLRVPSAK